MAGGSVVRRQRLYSYSLGFLRQPRLRRMLQLAGWDLAFGRPSRGDAVGVWGRRPVARRGRAIARLTGASLITLEDGFLRSLRPGTVGADPLSLVIDDLGIYYDAARPSRLERLLEDTDPDPALMRRAEHGIHALRAARLSKYTPPVARREFDSGHILVVDQIPGDASIAGAGASAATFRRMLDAARAENPGRRIIVKSHPDTTAGARCGHFSTADLHDGEVLVSEPVNPWDLIEGAACVYTVSSQMGYEAILANRPVRCFGAAFYAGWGLTGDEIAVPRRTRRLNPITLFAAAHLIYPIYYDPHDDRLCDFETVLGALSLQRDAETPVTGADGEVLCGFRLWKRRSILNFLPASPRPAKFADCPEQAVAIARAERRCAWFWASKVPARAADPLIRAGCAAGYVEDGFLRSVGLGAELTEAVSLVFDRRGIHFDPSRPSDLEDLIGRAAGGAADTVRAAALRQMIVAARVTKYNVGTPGMHQRPAGRHVILVPGQVEDDASVLRGCGSVRTNLGLLKLARERNPGAWLIYKPHPDVEAGLRQGAIAGTDAAGLSDEIARNASAADLIDAADEVWTLTSLLGFEALLRHKPVTCIGTPFYAGWGLTRDEGPAVSRRCTRPSLDELVWAALIAYPSYRDPISGLPCSPELVVERLARGLASPKANVLSRLQGAFAGQSWLWRR